VHRLESGDKIQTVNIIDDPAAACAECLSQRFLELPSRERLLNEKCSELLYVAARKLDLLSAKGQRDALGLHAS
jgi:hypothetical protein